VARSMDQRGDAVGQGKLPDVLGAKPLDLRTLGTSEDDVALDLTALLRRLLVGCNAVGKTWAQLMSEGWIVDALEGNARAVEDIFDRIEKGRLSRASATDAAPPIDDEMASKVLGVLSDSGDGATGD
jgi:hypothetical protein